MLFRSNIPIDLIDFSTKYTTGEDAGNIPIAYQKTGTITVVHDGLVVTGSGTKFLSELSVGDLLYSANDTGEYRKITAISSDTSLTVEAAFSGTTRSIGIWVAHATPSNSNVQGLIFWHL